LSSDKNTPTASAAETIYINVDDPRIGVLVYYGVLAYPKPSESADRQKFVNAMAAMHIKRFAAEIGSRKNIPTSFSRFKNEKIEGAKNLAFKRLAKRLGAGQIASLLCLKKLQPFDGVLLSGASTLNKMMQIYVAKQQNRRIEWDDHALSNAKHRVWVESFPVLHLAVTNPITVKIVDDIINDRLNARSKDIERDLLESIDEPDWLREALEDAENLRPGLGDALGTYPDDPLGRGFMPEKAIRLLPA